MSESGIRLGQTLQDNRAAANPISMRKSGSVASFTLCKGFARGRSRMEADGLATPVEGPWLIQDRFPPRTHGAGKRLQIRKGLRA